jgi:TonB family protein
MIWKIVFMMSTLLSAPRVLFCQDSATAAQLQQTMEVSRKRSQLEAEGAEPFRLVASFESFDAGVPNVQIEAHNKGTLDELWKSPREYKKTITVDGKQVVVVENGTQSWMTGDAVISSFIGLAINAVSTPFLELPPTINRVSREVNKENATLDCVGTEPKFEGVSEETRLALTTFCMARGNHLIRLILRPNDIAIAFNDIQPFGKKYIARSIEVTQGGRPIVRMHIDSLTPADDFSALSATPPDGAQISDYHRADHAYISNDLRRGQVLTTVPPIVPSTGFRGVVVVKVHVDTTGQVEHAEVLGSENQIIKNAALASVKQWRWRVSYEGDKLVPIDTAVELDFGSYLK